MLTAVYTLSVALPAWYTGEPAEGGRCDPTWRTLLPIMLILALMIAAGLWPGALMDTLRNRV